MIFSFVDILVSGSHRCWHFFERFEMGFQGLKDFRAFVFEQPALLLVQPLLFLRGRDAFGGGSQVLFDMIKIDGEFLFSVARVELFVEGVEDGVGSIGHRMDRAGGDQPGPDGGAAPDQAGYFDAGRGGPIDTFHRVFGPRAAEIGLFPNQSLVFALILSSAAFHNGNHASIHAGDHHFGRRGGAVHQRADALGVRERVLAGGAPRRLHSVVLAQLFGRVQKGFVRAEIHQRSLQGPRVTSLANVGLFAEGPHLFTAPAAAQALFGDGDIAIGRVPGQGFFFP